MNEYISSLFLKKELANKLKEKGFDWVCTGTYNINTGEVNLITDRNGINIKSENYSNGAVMIQQALDWLLVDKNFNVFTIYNFNNNPHWGIIIEDHSLPYDDEKSCFQSGIDFGEHYYKTKKEAILVAIEQALNYI